MKWILRLIMNITATLGYWIDELYIYTEWKHFQIEKKEEVSK